MTEWRGAGGEEGGLREGLTESDEMAKSERNGPSGSVMSSDTAQSRHSVKQTSVTQTQRKSGGSARPSQEWQKVDSRQSRRDVKVDSRQSRTVK